MTWQRIDENAYIDDTLVTCAEYQLFIDEMRAKKGKYCQPDHWSFLKFPAGSARNPITGVRYNDVDIFCQWLSQRENGEWVFRLPEPQEIELSPNIRCDLSPLGYWVNGKVNNKHNFAWLDPISHNPRNIVYDIKQHFGFEQDVDLTLPVDIDHHIATGITGTSTVEYARMYAEDPGARDRALDVARKRTRDLIIASTTKSHKKRYGVNTEGLDGLLMFLVDIITLQERIAGRSPAFEGIRLVKERIR